MEYLEKLILRSSWEVTVEASAFFFSFFFLAASYLIIPKPQQV